MKFFVYTFAGHNFWIIIFIQKCDNMYKKEKIYIIKRSIHSLFHLESKMY